MYSSSTPYASNKRNVRGGGEAAMPWAMICYDRPTSIQLILHTTVDDRRHGAAREFPTAERSVLAPRFHLLRVDGPAIVRVDDRHVGTGADAERPFVDADDLGRIDRHLADRLF